MSGLYAKPYGGIVAFTEQLLATHGDTAAGMGWTAADQDSRYEAMLDVLRPGSGTRSLLDFGCGSARLLEYMQRNPRYRDIEYTGLDVSAEAIAISRQKFPGIRFIELDVLGDPAKQWPQFDYVVMNGIFTYKGELAWLDMFEYMKKLLGNVFEHASEGIAFNVASKQVDWERQDLFHMPMDVLADFVSAQLSRHFTIRADYGLYEYTMYLYRMPVHSMPGKTRSLVRRGAPIP
jgi:SAM-dependent methyltransferase